ncbi:hypothetical protein A9Z42_0078100 [Trichoderma parareesei]|uniref:Uncharacterized protein n=1 Tax=Trichoderma parareesei TaxID=858221 RepID=A0A2H2ZJJ2_TRIPA|nr:hypothetical protein A9Z42_0078100 [Trichoderma parareesei]
MAKRGRPSLNLTPEERIQRRRLQLVASQRKRRAHKRLALQLSKAQPEPKPKPDTEPNSLPPRPDEAGLCRYYDAVFLGQDDAVTLSSSGSDAIAAETASTAKTTTARRTTRNTTKTSTRIVANVTRIMSSPGLQAPLTARHPCGSAPPDAISETSMASAPLAAVVGPHSRASLLQTIKPRIDTHAPSSRLEGPSVWADYTFAESGKSGISPAVFASEHMAYSTNSTMPLLGSVLDSSVQHALDLDSSHSLSQPATRSNRLLIAKDSDNVFSPGRFSTIESEWIPTDSHETPYSHRHIKPYHRRPPSPPSPDSGPVLLSVEAADLAAPWAAAKQAIPMGF